MKKVISLVLAVLMLTAMLCACTDPQASTPTTTQKPAPNPSASQNPSSSVNNQEPAAPTVVNVADYFADKSKWEDDGGYFTMSDDQILFDNFASGDYAAVRLTEQYQNVTYKFNVTINQLAPVSMEDWTWWDSEFCVIARSTMAGSSWPDDNGSQKGYTLTWWGDMKQVAIGRCGYDEACGTFDADISDGQPHDIEFTVINNADGTVSLKLVIDGAVVADVVDQGKPREDKPDRPTVYPDAGGLTLRAKWLEAVVK